MLFGKLTLDALPHEPIVVVTGIFMALGALAVLGLITYTKKWTWLWREWITTVDHKKIAVMYFILAAIMLLRGFADAALMRAQQVLSVGDSFGFLPPDHYDQIFTAHGAIMIFFMAMPFMFGLLNLAVPLQIGARDVAYPFLNSLSFWLTAFSAGLVMISLVVGKFASTGWLAYPPLSGIQYSPGVGVDYYIWALQISGVGSLISGINFLVTILKMRCPGMTLMKMPIFVWTALCSMILVILAFPVLTVTLGLLFLDRYFGMHFFTGDFGGNAMMYINLIWVWGHPEVYILVLPAFGIFSEIAATFSKKYLFGYVTMVWAIGVIAILAFVVWLHHFFTMGAGANVNAFFGIATMIIAIPTGVKIFNWLFTMFRGRITFTTPMLWMIGFFITFTVGGMTGIMLAVPGIDFQMHNSEFLVAHFHNVIIGGAVFGYFAGFTYWFPKMFGFRLHEGLGKCAFSCWIIGFYTAFMPLYILGMMGMSRRLQHYDAATGWHPYLVVAALGACIVALGIAFQVAQLVYSVINREKLKDTTGDPWDGRTLEWAIPSPAPFYNFAVTPEVSERDGFWHDKLKKKRKSTKYEDIHMPKNTPMGIIIAAFSAVLGFAMIWDITWLAVLSGIAMLGSVIARTLDYNIDYYVKVAEIKKIEAAYAKGAK